MTAAARRGVLAVLLAFVTLGTLNLLTVPSYAPRDESSHVAYALAVAEGRLPRVDDINPAGALPGLQPLRTWTANHPPLFYALVAAPLEIGRRTDHPLAGLRVARAINLGLAAIGVLLAGTVGALLLPRLPEAPILAAAATGLAGSVANTTAVVYNDGLGLAVSTALLVVGLRLLRDGPTRGRLALLTALAGVGALSRFTVVLAIAAASVLAAAAVWHAVRRRRVVATIGALVVPWIAAAAAAGWFYARNRNLYGSITGTDFIVRMTNRPPHPSFEQRPQQPQRAEFAVRDGSHAGV